MSWDDVPIFSVRDNGVPINMTDGYLSWPLLFMYINGIISTPVSIVCSFPWSSIIWSVCLGVLSFAGGTLCHQAGALGMVGNWNGLYSSLR